MARIESLHGQMARLGFGELAKVVANIETWPSSEAATIAVMEKLASAADPDLAFASFSRLVDINPAFPEQLAADQTWLNRTAKVLGASATFGQHLGANPIQLETLRLDISKRDTAALRRELLIAIGADPDSATPVAAATRSDDLRRAYRNALLRIAARDVTADDPMAILPEIAEELADLADATVEAALALARGEVAGWEQCRLGIVAMGKCGARELNYVSDVDLIYVAEPSTDESGTLLVDTATAITIATKLVGALARVCSAHTAAGTIWQIDANLRPEGKNGPLVRTLASHLAYYEKWAKHWEFQAMLKARPMAGDLNLAQDFVELVWPMVWRVADDSGFVTEVQAMRRRVISLLPAKEADYEIKLGAGGLRDVEFTTQLLQLVHGRTDERLRLRGTFEALAALVAYGYVGRSDGFDLGTAYRLQRVLEHRIQLYRLQRTHLMPVDKLSQRWLAKGIGVDSDKLLHLWRSTTRRVLTLHQRMFYSPLLEAVARIPSAEVRLTSEEAEARLQALGYGDPKAALKHIATLGQGVSRQAEIQRQILPAMLGWFTEGPNPDHGLLAFRQVSENLGRTPWYLRALRDGDVTAERFAKILSSGRYAVDLLLRNPQSAALLTDPSGLVPRQRAAILDEMQVSLRRHDSTADAITAIRAVRRSELLRLAMGDLIGGLTIEELGKALSDVTSATIDAALVVVRREISAPRLAVVALGRWGGQEMSYASDADALFVLEDSDDPNAVKNATALITKLRTLLSMPGPDPALPIDADLRPEGKGGAMVRTLASYAAYYQRWSSTWESQALLRASFGAGDSALTDQFLGEIVNPVRYPVAGLSNRQVQEIRKLKARMEAERIHGEAARHIKLGPGGLSDVEWVVQLLQLQNAGLCGEESLRDTTTLGALGSLTESGLIEAEDAANLRAAWLMASRIRNASMLYRGRASDLLPTDIRELSAIAGILGYAKGEASQLTQDYLRSARLARQVMDRLFWGIN